MAPRVARDWRPKRRSSFRRRPPLLPPRRRARPAPAALPRPRRRPRCCAAIARDGRDAFYEGEVAEDMVASLRALGGAHTLDDFAATACAYVEPIAGPYRGHELVELPPNGQGATAILLAKILARFDLAAPRPPRRRPRPPRGRGGEARLRRPRPLHRRPRRRRRSGSATCSRTPPPTPSRP